MERKERGSNRRGGIRKIGPGQEEEMTVKEKEAETVMWRGEEEKRGDPAGEPGVKRRTEKGQTGWE